MQKKRQLRMFLMSATYARWLRMFWRSLKCLFLLQIQITKEFFKMKFTTKSMIVQSYVILFLAGEIETIEEVPNIGNLREMVQTVLTTEQKSA